MWLPWCAQFVCHGFLNDDEGQAKKTLLNITLHWVRLTKTSPYLCNMETNLPTSGERKDVRALGLPQLEAELEALGERRFRARQLYQWLWQKAARNFDEMTDLSIKLREKLKEHYVINGIKVANEQHSKDGTYKYGYRLYDEHLVEGVLIPSPDFSRMTACVSSQVGCSLSCSFCATGFMERKRNLNADEIYDQVAHLGEQSERFYDKPLTNIVYMGMGEPLLNYANVLRSIERITSPDGLGISSKRITVSTAGIAKMIVKLADDETKFNLALSLHAANDEKRDKIMAINHSNSLSVLSDALRYYYRKLHRRVTYEYIAFANFNDGLQDARELAAFCRTIPCKVNIIEYNKVLGVDFEKTTEDKLAIFQQYLEKQSITTTLRRSRGKDIDAACGQLANKKH